MLNKLIKSNILVLVISNLTNVFNYLQQLVLGRHMSAEDYGIFNAVNSLGLIAAAMLNVMPFVVTKYVIKYQNQPGILVSLVGLFSRFTVRLGLVVCIACAMLSPFLADFLNIASRTPILVFVLWMFTSFLMLLYTGIMNGFMQYVRTTTQNTIHSLIRLLLVLLLVVWFGYSYNAAILSGVVANTLIAVWMFTDIRQRLTPAADAPSQALPAGEARAIFRFAVPVALNWIAVAILTNVDIVLVKHFCTAEEAGLFSGAAVIARIAVFLPMMLLSVLFPEVAKNAEDARASQMALWVTLGMTLGISGVFTLFVWWFPVEIMTLLFGDGFAAAGAYIPTVTASMGLVAVMSVFFSNALAKSDYRFLWPTYLGVFLALGLVYGYFSASPSTIASGIFWGCLLTIGLNLLWQAVTKPRQLR